MTTRGFRNQLRIVGIAFLLLACAGSVNSREPDLDTLLDQIIVAYGGEENLRKLNNYIQQWDVFALVGRRHGTDTRRIRVPDQLRVELNYPHRREMRVINGQSGHVSYRGEHTRRASHPQRDAMRLQLMRHYSPLVLRSKLDSLTLATGRESHVITLFEHGVRVDYFVNVENRRIEKVLGSLAINGTEMQFLTEYSNFVFRDGVLVHLEENKFAGGVNTATLKLRSLKLEADLTAADFSPHDDKATQPGRKEGEII